MKVFQRPNRHLVFLLVIVSAITLILTGCIGLNESVKETTPVTDELQQTQLDLELNWVKVNPSVVVPGQTVSLIAAVANNDSVERVYTTELKINDISKGMHEIDVSAGKTQTFSVFITEDEIGVYNVVFGGKAVQFEVVEQIDLSQRTGSIPDPSAPSCCQ
jgi:hypothetical protein